MQRFRRAISFRRSQRHVPESCRPHQWESDSHKVKSGGISFPVKVRIFACICLYVLLKGSQVFLKLFHFYFRFYKEFKSSWKRYNSVVFYLKYSISEHKK